jgi:hypothetical protein
VNRPAIVIGALFFLFGLLAIVGGWGAYHLDTSIERHGGRAIGYVTKKIFLSASDGDSDYILEYRFALPSGEPMNARRGVSKELWSSLKEGESLVVLYQHENPNRNFPAGAGVTSFGVMLFVAVLGIVFVVFGLLVFVNGLGRRPADA